MSDVAEHTLGELTLQIDRTLCVGFGDCIEVAPELFEFDDEGIVVIRTDASEIERERLTQACEICPVDALTLLGPHGRQIAP